MDFNPYDIALIGIGGTVIGTLLGAWVGYRLSISLSKMSAKREAGRRLIMSFSEELAKLNPANSISDLDVHWYLERAFPKHHAAMIEFGFYLEGIEKDKYVKACTDYFMVAGSARFFDYINGVEGRQLFSERVNNILCFAKQT